MSAVKSTDVSEMPVEEIFSALPFAVQENMQRTLALLSEPGVTLKKRMFGKVSGVMAEPEQFGHIEHLGKRLQNPEAVDLQPTSIEVEFDSLILAKFKARQEKLQQDVEEVEGEEKVKLQEVLGKILVKIGMTENQRICELYRQGLIKSTQDHKRKLAKFASTLTEALFEFTPQFAEHNNLDRKTVMEYIRWHDAQKILHCAPFAGNVFDKDLGDTYANFKNPDRALEMFFNACVFHNIIDGSREFGHHPHAAKGLVDCASCDKLRQFLTNGIQDFCRVVETMADTLEASFSRRILTGGEVGSTSNPWLTFAAKEFCVGGAQEVPVDELLMRYRILLTNPELKTLDECKDAVMFADESGELKLATTPMLRKISPIFERLAILGETL